jgi:hypothetical protein
VSPMNTLSAMSEGIEVRSQNHRVDLRDAPGEASFPAVVSEVQHGEDAQEIPLLFHLARTASILLIAALVFAYFIVAIGVAGFKARWQRGRRSHTE